MTIPKISLHDALFAIKEHLDSSEYRTIVIGYSKVMASPVVGVSSDVKNSPTLSEKLDEAFGVKCTYNCDKLEGVYEALLFPAKPSTSESQKLVDDATFPDGFFQAFKEGDVFKVVKEHSVAYLDVSVGDTFTINLVDKGSDYMTYCVEPNNMWLRDSQFCAAILSGQIVKQETEEKEKEEEVLPFHQRYEVGDKFKIVNSESEFLCNFSKAQPGDVLTVVRADDEDSGQPYKLSLTNYLDEGWWSNVNSYKNAFNAGDIVEYTESTPNIPSFDAAQLKKGFKFVILDAARWKAEVGKNSYGLDAEQVTVTLEDEDGMIKIKDSNDWWWYSRSSVAKAFDLGIVALCSPISEARTMVLDGVEYILTPKVK
jgi:hypothetical protein